MTDNDRMNRLVWAAVWPALVAAVAGMIVLLAYELNPLAVTWLGIGGAWVAVACAWVALIRTARLRRRQANPYRECPVRLCTCQTREVTTDGWIGGASSDVVRAVRPDQRRYVVGVGSWSDEAEAENQLAEDCTCSSLDYGRAVACPMHGSQA